MTSTQGPSQPDAGPPFPSGAAAMNLGAYVSKAWQLITADLALFVLSYLIVVGHRSGLIDYRRRPPHHRWASGIRFCARHPETLPGSAGRNRGHFSRL